MENSKTVGVSSDSENVYTELRTVVPDQFYTYWVFIKKKKKQKKKTFYTFWTFIDTFNHMQ